MYRKAITFISSFAWLFSLVMTIGTPTSVSKTIENQPVSPQNQSVSGSPIEGIAAVAVGYKHSCAVTLAGGVKCWGDNSFWQLGDPYLRSSSVPVDIKGLPGTVTAIAAGAYFTCALTTSGTVACWGDSSRPTLINNLSGVKAITAKFRHICALMDTGGVKCWGNNINGQLGDGTTTSRTAPVDVIGLTGEATAVSTSNYHTCALMKTGGVMCWGWNNYYQLGDGTNTNTTSPVVVQGLPETITEIFASPYGTYAKGASGMILVWGNVLLSGTAIVRPSYATVLGSPVTMLDFDLSFSCAVVAGGLNCWSFEKSWLIYEQGAK